MAMFSININNCEQYELCRGNLCFYVRHLVCYLLQVKVINFSLSQTSLMGKYSRVYLVNVTDPQEGSPWTQVAGVRTTFESVGMGVGEIQGLYYCATGDAFMYKHMRVVEGVWFHVSPFLYGVEIPMTGYSIHWSASLVLHQMLLEIRIYSVHRSDQVFREVSD